MPDLNIETISDNYKLNHQPLLMMAMSNQYISAWATLLILLAKTIAQAQR